MTPCANGRADAPPACGTCKHWHPLPADPNCLDGVRRGQCREGPPHLTMLPGQGGAAMMLSDYVRCAENFPACSRHRPRLALEVVG